MLRIAKWQKLEARVTLIPRGLVCKK